MKRKKTILLQTKPIPNLFLDNVEVNNVTLSSHKFEVEQSGYDLEICFHAQK